MQKTKMISENKNIYIKVGEENKEVLLAAIKERWPCQ